MSKNGSLHAIVHQILVHYRWNTSNRLPILVAILGALERPAQL